MDLDLGLKNRAAKRRAGNRLGPAPESALALAVPKLSIRARELGFVAATILVCLAVGKVLPRELDTLTPKKLIAFSVGLPLIVWAGWLSVARPLAAFSLGFALLGIVLVEPAPVDVVFGLLIASTYVLRNVRPLVPSFVALPLAGYALLTLTSMLNATSLSRAIQFEAITLYMIILAVWLSWAFKNPVWVTTAMRVYLIVAVFSAILAPVALYLPIPGSLKSILTFGGLRAKGLFKDPNVYSPFLVPAAIILREELTGRKLLTWRRSVIAGALALVSLAIAVAYSRAGWLNLVLGVATLIVVQAARSGGLRKAAKSAAMIVAGLAIGFAFLSATGSLTFLHQRSTLQSYDQQRFANQDNAINDATRHVFGFGPGQSEVLLPLSAHETYVRAAFEEGLLGVATILMMFVGTLMCALVLVRRQRYVHGIGTASLLGIWLGQTVNGFFVDTIHWRHLWIFAALIWCGYGLGGN